MPEGRVVLWERAARRAWAGGSGGLSSSESFLVRWRTCTTARLSRAFVDACGNGAYSLTVSFLLHDVAGGMALRGLRARARPGIPFSDCRGFALMPIARPLRQLLMRGRVRWGHLPRKKRGRLSPRYPSRDRRWRAGVPEDRGKIEGTPAEHAMATRPTTGQ